MQILTAVTAFLTVALHGSVNPALAGLSLTYVTALGGTFQYTTRLSAEVSSNHTYSRSYAAGLYLF